MKYWFGVGFLALSILVTSCGRSSDSGEERGNLGNRETFPTTYSLAGVDHLGRPCKVMVRSKTNDERCENLMSQSKNNQCARKERRELFEQVCKSFRIKVFVETP